MLVPTIVEGINDHEIGDILRFGLGHPAVLGINYQPATSAGRSPARDPLRRATVTGVLHFLEEQTEGMLKVDDFIPVPCPHPICSACTYVYVDGEDVVPLTRLVDVEDYIDFVTNRAGPDWSSEIHEAAVGLWSMATAMGTDKATGQLGCLACGLDLSLPADLKALKRSFFMVQVHGFMDAHTFDLQRLMKCCIHQLLPDGRAVPFCAYNVLGYREQVRRAQEDGR